MWLWPAAFMGASPRPCVAKPEGRQYMHGSNCWPAIGNGDADQDVVGVFFCVLGAPIEVTIACRQVPAREACGCDAGFRPPGDRRDIRAADTCTTLSYTNASESNRDSNILL